jgi:hypothetical protein
MKKVLLMLMVLLTITAPAFAKVYLFRDKFSGHSAYYTSAVREKDMLDMSQLYYQFELKFFFLPEDATTGRRSVLVNFTSPGAYLIKAPLTFNVDGTFYAFNVASKQYRNGDRASAIFYGVDENLIKALGAAKQDVKVQISYSTVNGDFMKYFTLKQKDIKDIVDMYKMDKTLPANKNKI